MFSSPETAEWCRDCLIVHDENEANARLVVLDFGKTEWSGRGGVAWSKDRYHPTWRAPMVIARAAIGPALERTEFRALQKQRRERGWAA